MTDIKTLNEENFCPKILHIIVKGINSGDIKGVEAVLDSVKYSDILPVSGFSGSNLQKDKYAAVAAVAAVSSHISGGGLLFEHASAMLELFIYSVDKAKNVEEIYQRIREIFIGFARIVSDKLNTNTQISAVITDAQNFISRNLHYDLRLSDIASECGLSASYLSFLFKKETDMTVSEYIMREKLREAEYMLIIGKYKISEICYSLNFCSQSYFTKYFKKYYGVTPAQYKKTGMHCAPVE